MGALRKIVGHLILFFCLLGASAFACTGRTLAGFIDSVSVFEAGSLTDEDLLRRLQRELDRDPTVAYRPVILKRHGARAIEWLRDRGSSALNVFARDLPPGVALVYSPGTLRRENATAFFHKATGTLGLSHLEVQLRRPLGPAHHEQEHAVLAHGMTQGRLGPFHGYLVGEDGTIPRDTLEEVAAYAQMIEADVVAAGESPTSFFLEDVARDLDIGIGHARQVTQCLARRPTGHRRLDRTPGSYAQLGLDLPWTAWRFPRGELYVPGGVERLLPVHSGAWTLFVEVRRQLDAGNPRGMIAAARELGSFTRRHRFFEP